MGYLRFIFFRPKFPLFNSSASRLNDLEIDCTKKQKNNFLGKYGRNIDTLIFVEIGAV